MKSFPIESAILLISSEDKLVSPITIDSLRVRKLNNSYLKRAPDAVFGSTVKIPDDDDAFPPKLYSTLVRVCNNYLFHELQLLYEMLQNLMSNCELDTKLQRSEIIPIIIPLG